MEEVAALDLSDSEAHLHLANMRTLITMYRDLTQPEKRDLLSLLIKMEFKLAQLTRERLAQLRS